MSMPNQVHSNMTEVAVYTIPLFCASLAVPCKDTADIELDLEFDFNFEVQTEVMKDHVYLWRNF